MKKHAILFALILSFASITFAQEDKTAKPAKSETPKAETAKTETKNAKLPTAKEVFDRNFKATGERSAIEKVKSRSIKGTVEMPAMGLKGTFEIVSKAPNKSAALITLSGFGELVEAFDGTEAWAKDPLQGLRVKTGKELEEVKDALNIEYDYDFAKFYPKAVVTGIEKVGGADTYVVKANDDATFYFDKQTGLMTRSDRSVTSPQGKVQSMTTFEDFRVVDGVKQPFVFRQNALGMEMVFNASEIKQNVEIADERFSKPK